MNEYVTYDAIRKRLILPLERRFAVVPPRLLTTNTNDSTVFHNMKYVESYETLLSFI